MLKIAVCDDNESFLETLKKIISESARDYFKDINVQCFNNGQRLLNQHKRLFFDVILSFFLQSYFKHLITYYTIF